MRRVCALVAALTLASCSDGPDQVAQRLVKARFPAKPTVLGSYYDHGDVVVVYRDDADYSGAWTRYRCHPPAGKSRWYCEKVGNPDSAFFLDE